MSALLPMSGAMPIARTVFALLILALAAAPAHASPVRVTIATDSGGAELASTPGAADEGGAAAWPGDGDIAPGPGGTPFGQPLPLPLPLPRLPQVPVLPQPVPQLPAVTTSFVPGTVARLRTDGRAAIPRSAPKRVRSLISQYNRIVGRRYRWGGGHAVVEDTAFDCSGAVGYGLIKTGLLRSTMVSGSFARWAAPGAGRWMTIYANRSHVYTEVAGLRLDTSAVGDPSGAGGVRWRPVIGERGGFEVRHPVGL
jgi:hypothetical protein